MVKMAGSNRGASSAYTEAGPPEMMIALWRWKYKGGTGVRVRARSCTITHIHMTAEALLLLGPGGKNFLLCPQHTTGSELENETSRSLFWGRSYQLGKDHIPWSLDRFFPDWDHGMSCHCFVVAQVVWTGQVQANSWATHVPFPAQWQINFVSFQRRFTQMCLKCVPLIACTKAIVSSLVLTPPV